MSDKVKKSITIDQEIVDILEKIGEKESRKFSNMVNKILRDFVEEWKKNEKKDEQ
jgi:metal-responsive CopG/Arc/MetJ family transcriptional regulator